MVARARGLGFVAHGDERLDAADAPVGQLDETIAPLNHRLLQVLIFQDVKKRRVAGGGIVEVEEDGEALFLNQAAQPLLRGGADDATIQAKIAEVWRQRNDRYSEIRTAATAGLKKVEMSYIGG